MDRQSFVEQAVRAILAAGVKAARANDLEASMRSLDEAVAVYESNPSCVHTPYSHFHSVALLVQAAGRSSKNLGHHGDSLRELSGRLDALKRAIH